jgi:hypothetical protein
MIDIVFRMFLYRDGPNNGNTGQYRNKTVCVGCTGITLFVSIFHYSFVCLLCAVPVSVHYRLCSVTVRMKVLQNGKVSALQRGQVVSAGLAEAYTIKAVTISGVSIAAVAMVGGIHE